MLRRFRNRILFGETGLPYKKDRFVHLVIVLNVRFATKALGEAVVFQNIRLVMFDL